MARKVERLTVDHLARLPGRCRTCLFWEVDPVRRARLDPEEAALAKEAWVSELLREWGSCGRVVLVDEEVAGYAVYAPAAFVPGAGAFPTSPVSPDAVLLSALHVDAAHAGGGLGRVLVQAMARDLIQRGRFSAVEAFGTVGSARRPCTVPADFLGSVGFKTQRPHLTTPRMRMDLRTALTWRDEVEAVLDRLVGVVRPVAPPARPPASTRASGRTTRASGR